MPKRKIFDITPPSETKKTGEAGQIFVVEEEFARTPRRARSKRFLILLPLILLSTAAGILYISIKPRAEIEILPKFRLSDFETQLIVDQESGEPNFNAHEIPGKIIEAESLVSEEIPSSGAFYREEKARGVIHVYNAYSVYSQALIANTRFVSADGKIFRIQKPVVIPGGHYDKGKLIPGSINVEVVADQPGPDYNIGPSAFSIPGFAGTAKYTAFYGKSSSPMEGGKKVEAHRVTQDDLDKAKNKLSAKALNESKILLKNKLGPESLMSEETVSAELLETVSLAKVNEEKESFIFQAKAKAKNLSFGKAVLDNFAKDYLRRQISPQQAFSGESIAVEYSPEIVDIKAGKITFNIKISAKIYSEADEKQIKKRVSGKSYSDVRNELMAIYPENEKIKIDFWPFWTLKAPDDIEKIRFKLLVP